MADLKIKKKLFYKTNSLQENTKRKLTRKKYILIIQIDLKVIRVWIDKRITDILTFEDEFLVNYIISLLEDPSEEMNPKKIQILLTGIYPI